MTEAAPPGLLIDQLLPGILVSIESQKEAAIDKAGGPLRREAVRLAWPYCVALAPGFIRAGYLAVLKTIGSMTISGLLDRLQDDYAVAILPTLSPNERGDDHALMLAVEDDQPETPDGP